MRRLINWLYAKFLGLIVITHAQLIADLERELDELYMAAMHIDAEIEIVADRLRRARMAMDNADKQSNRVLQTTPADGGVNIIRSPESERLVEASSTSPEVRAVVEQQKPEVPTASASVGSDVRKQTCPT